MVYKQECPYDASLANRILNLYSGWLDTSEKVVALYDSFEADYAARGRGRDLVLRIKNDVCEVRGILTPDDQFFVGDKLAKLRDAALEGHGFSTS